MRNFKSLVAAFCCMVWCICAGDAAGKTDIDYFNEAHVWFDVQKSSEGLTFVGKELGRETFRLELPSSSFDSFTEQRGKNFNLRKLEHAILFRYRGGDSREALDLLVNPSGDITFLQTEDEYTGWNEHKRYGIKTFGTIENHTNHVFYFLVASANAIHNYGTIQTYNIQLIQHYLFNSGVLQFGVTPTQIEDLTTGHLTDGCAVPNYKRGTVENYGTFMANGKVSINSGLNYHEHGLSDFEDLNTSGGNVDVQQGRMNVSGNMSGTVGSFGVGKNARFSVNKLWGPQLKDFSIAEGGLFHSASSLNLNVSGNFSNAGEMTSGADLTLHLSNAPGTNQPGIIFAKNVLNYSYERKDGPRDSKRTPDITKDPIARQQLMQHHPDPNSPEFKRVQEEFYNRVGYNPDDDRGEEIFDPGQLLAKTIRRTIYTDHYLNTITYHYTVTKDQYGREIRRELTDVTETGYIWQRRTQETKEITLALPVDLEQLLDKKNGDIQGFSDFLKARTELARKIANEQAAKRRA
ncbi:MAG: hypothetical protein LBB34_00175, partial [Holosporales bacterium]|nr:hypothetical protein [Holosporales bacterium]